MLPLSIKDDPTAELVAQVAGSALRVPLMPTDNVPGDDVPARTVTPKVYFQTEAKAAHFARTTSENRNERAS